MKEVKNEKILKKTILYNNHLKLGAKIVPYSGFLMPLQYLSSLEEHIYVRKFLGIFDVSHMGKFIIKGKNSKNFIQYLTTNDLSLIKDGQAQYSCLVNYKGGIIDDIVIYQITKNKFLIIVNAINIKKNKEWIENHIKNFNNLELIDLSNQYSLLSIQGPLSLNYLQKLTDIILEKIPFYHFKIGSFDGIKEILIARTGYTGSKGLELFIPNKHSIQIWNKILDIGKNKIVPCGIASRDSLRIEMGYRLYGQDISENITPIESGLSWIVKFNKEFISKNILISQKKNGVYKKFISFYVDSKKIVIPRKNYILLDKNENKIGYITSGNYSPILKKSIGLGYLFNNKVKKNNYNPIYMLTKHKKIPIVRKKVPFI